MGFVFDQFQTSKPFRRAGFIYYLSYLSLSVCWCKRCSKYERKKIGMLKIENYKNKSNMEINKNNDKNKEWKKARRKRQRRKKQIHMKIKQVRKKKSFLKGSLVPKKYIDP